MPRPSQSAKIARAPTRGSALIILRYGSNTRRTAALREPKSDQDPGHRSRLTRASTDSTSVIHRCFQIVPSTNHLTMRGRRPRGREEERGSSFPAPIGTVVKAARAATAAIATRSWSIKSVNRDMTNSDSRRHGRAYHGHPRSFSRKVIVDGRNKSVMTSSPAYGFENVPMMPVAPLACPSKALKSSSRVMPGLQRARLEVGGDQL